MRRTTGTLGTLAERKVKKDRRYQPVPCKWLATTTNGAALLYWESLMPVWPSCNQNCGQWTAQRAKAHRFAAKSTAAKYGTPVKARA